MTQIIWINGAGEIGITTLVEAQDAQAEAAKLLADGAIPAGFAVDHVRPTAGHYTLTEPEFFAALTAAGGEIVVDMPKAREIWRERIRATRAPLLAALDVEWQRADETGAAESKPAIAAAKQALRDLPQDPAIEAATSIAELRASWRADLLGQL